MESRKFSGRWSAEPVSHLWGWSKGPRPHRCPSHRVVSFVHWRSVGDLLCVRCDFWHRRCSQVTQSSKEVRNKQKTWVDLTNKQPGKSTSCSIPAVCPDAYDCSPRNHFGETSWNFGVPKLRKSRSWKRGGIEAGLCWGLTAPNVVIVLFQSDKCCHPATLRPLASLPREVYTASLLPAAPFLTEWFSEIHV